MRVGSGGECREHTQGNTVSPGRAEHLGLVMDHECPGAQMARRCHRARRHQAAQRQNGEGRPPD